LNVAIATQSIIKGKASHTCADDRLPTPGFVDATQEILDAAKDKAIACMGLGATKVWAAVDAKIEER
jgi:hypothetical protein